MTIMRKHSPIDRWIPWSFVGFFLVVFLVNGIMLYFALGSWTGITTDDAYKKGLAYNDRLAEAEAQAKLGWQTRLAVPKEAGVDSEIVLTLRDRDGGPVSGAEVRARLVRPTHEGYDQEVSLVGDGRGQYRAAVALPLPGLWVAQVHVAHDRGSLKLSERFRTAP